MKNLTPKQIAIYAALLICLVSTMILFLVNVVGRSILPNYQYVIVALIIFISSYLIFYFAVEKFIYQRIKLIYKSIYTQKSAKYMNLKRISDSTIIEDVESEVMNWRDGKTAEVEQLKRNEIFRREFLGNVSHELKTPLFNIQGYIETLLDGAIDDEKINRKYLERAVKNIERLGAIIEDLEFISLSENGKLNLTIKPFKIEELMSEVIESLEFKAKEANIKLRIKKNMDISEFVVGDREKIGQVLINLVANSIKYGIDGGYTSLSWYDMDENMLIEVSDNGIGIDKRHLSRLFERFYRVDTNRSRKQGGTGLGLSIVKHIVEAHNQTINVRSTVGVGSTFGFTLKKK